MPCFAPNCGRLKFNKTDSYTCDLSRHSRLRKGGIGSYLYKNVGKKFVYTLGFPPFSPPNKKKFVSPGEARTHNPGIAQLLSYKYRALTDCATGDCCVKGPFYLFVCKRWDFRVQVK